MKLAIAEQGVILRDGMTGTATGAVEQLKTTAGSCRQRACFATKVPAIKGGSR